MHNNSLQQREDLLYKSSLRKGKTPFCFHICLSRSTSHSDHNRVMDTFHLQARLSCWLGTNVHEPETRRVWRKIESGETFHILTPSLFFHQEYCYHWLWRWGLKSFWSHLAPTRQGFIPHIGLSEKKQTRKVIWDTKQRYITFFVQTRTTD